MAAKRRTPSKRNGREASLVGEPLVAESAAAVIACIRRGYPWPFAHGLQEELSLSDQDFASFLGVSSRTLSRWRKSEDALDKVASDRLYRLMRVVQLAGEVFEGREDGLRWLRRPQAGLGGKVPLELLDTEPGFEVVENLLAQIEYGVIS